MSSFGGYGPPWVLTLTLTVYGPTRNEHIQPCTLIKHIWDEFSLWSDQCRPCQPWDATTGPLLTFAHSFESEDMVD